MKKVVNAVIIKEKKKILLLKEGDRLILPGGEPREGESDKETLERKLKEEALGAGLKKSEYYKTFKERDLEVVTYFIELKKPDLGIEGSVLIGYEDTTRFRFSYPTGEIIKDLFKEGHLNAC